MNAGPSSTCPVCQGYLQRRSKAIAVHTVAIARSRGVSSLKLFVRYMTAVHDRHLAGESIEVAA